jgi:hypothetical protein
MYKVLGKVKFMRPIADALKAFAGNLQAGGYAKTPLSSQLEILNSTVGDPNDQLYDVKSFSNAISAKSIESELDVPAFIRRKMDR